MQSSTPKCLSAIAAFLVFILSTNIEAQAQTQTIGLFHNDSLAYNGYTLFCPTSSRDAYLIDNCGYQINVWRGVSRPAQSVYLLDDGSLLRTGRVPTATYIAGGSGGMVEIYDWDNNLVWEYEYSTSAYHQHHDVEMLPNGNILILAWEGKTSADAINNGRDPSALTPNGLWPESIVEVEPVGLDSGNIVWKWSMWDHLVQEFDSTKANYGVVADHPELVDINFRINSSADWVHANGIDYNEELDQILISVRHFSEFWIIDHSTTTAEAASHSGGNSGMGGDLLYRWGNPQVYNRGTSADRQSWFQHHANWIPEGHPDEGKIIFFNNGTGRPGGDFSTVDIIDPPIDTSGNYFISPTDPFGPDTTFWTFDGGSMGIFYSSILSGVTQLPNGNALICSANEGRFFEVDKSGNLHWDYICPANNTPIVQGSIPNANSAFRADRYSPDFPGFIGKDLTPGAPIELSPIPYACNIYPAGPANCDAPVGLAATALDPTTVTLSWASAPNDFKYQIQGRIAGSGSGFAARISSTNSKTLPGLTPGESYEWKVRKLCTDSSISAFSTLETFTMPTSLMAKVGHERGYDAYFTANSLYLDGPATGEVRLVDLSGRVIFQREGSLGTGEFAINSDLPTGVYFLEVYDQDGYWTKKMYR